MENKNQKDKMWFKAKNYGWGWYPVTWQGWLVIFLYGLAILKVALRAVMITESHSNSASEFLWNYLPPLFILSILMIWICYKKGEKPQWRWNGKPVFKK